MKQLFLIAALLLAVCGQTPLAIDTANARETVVSGTASVDSGPIVVVNVHFPIEAKLGTGTVLPNGTFAVAIKGELLEGEALVAVDKAGRRSSRFNVRPPRTGPTPPARPPN